MNEEPQRKRRSLGAFRFIGFRFHTYTHLLLCIHGGGGRRRAVRLQRHVRLQARGRRGGLGDEPLQDEHQRLRRARVRPAVRLGGERVVRLPEQRRQRSRLCACVGMGVGNGVSYPVVSGKCTCQNWLTTTPFLERHSIFCLSCSFVSRLKGPCSTSTGNTTRISPHPSFSACVHAFESTYINQFERRERCTTLRLH